MNLFMFVSEAFKLHRLGMSMVLVGDFKTSIADHPYKIDFEYFELWVNPSFTWIADTQARLVRYNLRSILDFENFQKYN